MAIFLFARESVSDSQGSSAYRVKEPEQRINSLQRKDSATAGVEDNERRVSWAVSSLRWYPCKRCTATVLSALCRHPRNRVLNLNDLRWTPIREATIVKQNILACNTDSISQKRSAARALRRRKHPNAKAFLHVNKLLIRLLSNKDEIPFCKLKARGFSCTTESGCLCSRLFEHVFFFCFLYTSLSFVCVCVSRLVLQLLSVYSQRAIYKNKSFSPVLFSANTCFRALLVVPGHLIFLFLSPGFGRSRVSSRTRRGEGSGLKLPHSAIKGRKEVNVHTSAHQPMYGSVASREMGHSWQQEKRKSE